MGKYKTYKCFEWRQLPDEAKKYLEKRRDLNNDSYLRWYMLDEHKPYSEYKGGEILSKTADNYIIEKGDNPVDDWLLENGATPQDNVVLILVSW